MEFDAGEEWSQVFFPLIGRFPQGVVIAMNAQIAGGVELRFAFEDATVGGEHRLGALFPQVLGVTHDDQREILVQVMVERGEIRDLRSDKVVGLIACALVVVGEDHVALLGSQQADAVLPFLAQHLVERLIDPALAQGLMGVTRALQRSHKRDAAANPQTQQQRARRPA
ncbi:MAG TPA: hypothetical protein PKV82_06220 [Anaerolineae bacterium]|nr:hypothetical protein [Anaerolineae bacterium]